MSEAPAAVDPAPAPHLHAVDVVRILTIVGVIAVHSTSNLLPTESIAAGAVLAVLHVTREVFLVLSAFVLAYAAAARPLDARRFWRRRYPLIMIPYVVWSAIYLAEDAGSGPVALAERAGRDLLTAGAKYHLYFLLLTMQLYLVFPVLLRWLRRYGHRWKPIAAASLSWQLLFTAAIHYRWPLPPPLTVWAAHPGSWLPSYELYVVVGLLIGIHHEAVLAWVATHRRLLGGATLAVLAVGLATYGVDVALLGMPALRAGEVFQPAVVVEAVALLGGQLALGSWLAERWSPSRRAWLERGSDVSFGVYLAHPLLLDGLVAAASASGLAALTERLPIAASLPLVVLGLAPALALTTAFVVDRLRRTPLSLALTGRRVRSPVDPRPALVINRA